MTVAPARDRAPIWLALVRRLTAVAPTWTTMKGIDSALTGTGDVDSVAPLTEWPLIRREFTRWAGDHGLGPVVVCPHAPFLLHLIALDPEGPVFFELDVNRRKIFLGATLFEPSDLAPMVRMDPRGFRSLRPGAEGVLKLVQNGAKRGGRADWPGVRAKRVGELLAEDPDGVRQGASLFGRAARDVERAAASVIRGEWDRAAMVRVELWCLVRALGRPSGLVARARFRAARQRCPVLRAVLEQSRRVPADRASWLREVGGTHHVERPDVEVRRG